MLYVCTVHTQYRILQRSLARKGRQTVSFGDGRYVPKNICAMRAGSDVANFKFLSLRSAIKRAKRTDGHIELQIFKYQND